MSDLPKLSEVQDGLKAISEHFQGENVIYEALTPPYVVQERQVEYYTDGTESSGVWLDIKGFSRDTFAVGYADELKRENPATDYRVVKSQSEEDQ